jgi:hypothetical protein
MDKQAPAEKIGEPSSSNDEVPPPAFSEDPTLQIGEQPPYVNAPSAGGDFPDAGEMNIPNVSPMTAHVSNLCVLG